MGSHQQNGGAQPAGRGAGTGAVKGEAASKGGHASHQGGQKQPPLHGAERDDQSHLKQDKSGARGGGGQSHKNK